MKTRLVLAACAMLSVACAPRVTVVPDQTIPHRVAREGELEVWARAPDGQLHRQKVRVLEGWWLASPAVVEGP
jgi:hypothetical protein